MTFSWKEETDDASVVDKVIVCRVDERIVGRLHYYDGVGYFAYFREQHLNRTPVATQRVARESVQSAYAQWISQRSTA